MPDTATTDLDRRLSSLPPERRALLARRLAGRGLAGAGPETIPRRTGAGPWPVSSSQHRLWFLDQLERGNPAYNVYRAVRMRGALDPAALARSLSEVVRRHEVLRSTFPATDGCPVQEVHLASPVRMPIVDLTAVPAGCRDIDVACRAFAEAHRRFDLTSGPMLRATLLRLEAEDHVLLLTCHHIVADGWSVGILFRELAALYEDFTSGKPASLPDLPIQYADYAVWQRGWLEGPAYREQLAYWRGQLAAPPAPLDLPTDRPRSALKTTKGERHFFEMPRSAFDGLAALARQVQATPFIGLLAAFQLLLSRQTGQADIAVGSPVAGRSQAETEGLIGCFSNTLVLRTDLSGGPTFRQLLERVREVALGGYAHQDFPFERLVRELQPRRDPSRMTFFQVNFRLLTAPPPSQRLGAVDLEFLEVDNHRAKFDLSVEFRERPEALAGYIEYYTDLYDRRTIATMAEDFEALIASVTARPDVPTTELVAPDRAGAIGPASPIPSIRSDTPMSRDLRSARRKAVGLSSEPPGPAGPPREPGSARYQLRQATLRDADFLYRLRKESMAQFVTRFDDWSEDRREAFYMDFDPAMHSIILVDGREAGALCVRKSDEEYYFANLHIHVGFQGRGLSSLGNWVTRDVIAEADARGVPIRLHVMKINGARKLYERLGAVVVAENDIRFEMIRPRRTAPAKALGPDAASRDAPPSGGPPPGTTPRPPGLRQARRKSVEIPEAAEGEGPVR